MHISSERKVAKVGNSLRVVVPKPICDGLGIKPGDILVFSVGDGDELTIRKKD
jgi:AbrB family looped-hinge helix DNA binding protein